MKPAATFREETAFWRQGVHLVAGLDEVGRGALAGPVAAAAVILPPGARFRWLKHVQDSKVLTPAIRADLASHIHGQALAVGIGFVSHEAIDRIGIVPATRLAMRQALSQLPLVPQQLLIDALLLPDVPLPQKAIIDGDALSRTIACASIVAKVARDALMCREHSRFGSYGFSSNKGYATPHHLRALQEFGPCDIHRRTFSPLRQPRLPLFWAGA